MTIARAAALCLGWCAIHRAPAQELNPRAYVIAPVGINAVSLGYSHQNGSLQFDGSVPITGATADISLVALGYYRSLDFFGRTANIAVALPYGIGDFAGTVVGVPRSAHRTGLLDSSVRFSVNLIGGPAMEPAEFARWTEKVLLGVSLKIVAPTGQYDPTLLVNWGNNRWAFKPEIGYSQRWGHWVLDGFGAAWFFTENPEFFCHNAIYAGTRSQSERPVGAFETHLSYDVRSRLWVSLDANFWWGGETSVNGVRNPQTSQRSSRVGLTASIPFTAHQAVKISFSDGAYVLYGGNYKSVSLFYQYNWAGRPSFP